MPGTPAAGRFSGMTSWEPVQKRALTAKDMRRKKMRVAEEKQEDKVLRKQYHLATTKSLDDTRATYTVQTRTQYLRAAELPETMWYSDADLDHLTEEEEHAILDRAALRIESLRAGSHRSSRHCMECLFQLGRFKKAPVITRKAPTPGELDEWGFCNNKGTPAVPIVRSRRLKFATPFDRYFPGIAPYMSAERPDFILPLWRIHRADTTYMTSTLYMARCPSCTVWQELRDFRWPPRGWAYGEFMGVWQWMTEAEAAAHAEEVNSMQCNKCMHKQLGHAALAQRLSTFIRARLKTECRAVLDILSGGWHRLSYLENKLQYGHKSTKSTIKSLIASLEAAEKNFAKVEHSAGWNEIDVEAEDLEDNLARMSRRRQEWLHIAVQEPDLANACVSGLQEFRVWHDEWDQAIGYLRWAKALVEEVEKEPEKVVKWALERNPIRLK